MVLYTQTSLLLSNNPDLVTMRETEVYYSDDEENNFLRIVPVETEGKFLMSLITEKELNEIVKDPNHKKGYVIPILTREKAAEYKD